MADNKIIMTGENIIPRNEKGERILSDRIMSDCFVSMSVSLLTQFFLSSDSKYLIIQGMYTNLRIMGYTEDEVKVIQNGMIEIADKLHIKNDFMG